MTDEGKRSDDAVGRGEGVSGLVPLLVVVIVTGWIWAPLLALPFTGEDYVLMGRLKLGLLASPHVFRPLLSSWLGGLHTIFGAENALPFHAATLALHLANTALVFLLGRRLFGSARIAVVAAAFFGLGAGALDALAWIAAVNRPLSTFGALLALNGVVRLGERAWAPFLCVVGLAWQFGANEDFYGTALFFVAWLVGVCVRRPELRRTAGALALLAAGGVAFHYLVIRQIPGGSQAVLAAGMDILGDSVVQRNAHIAAGFGLPLWAGILLAPLATLALWASGRRRAALFLFLAWGSSMVPFVLSDPIGYRFYPTQASAALLLVGGVACLAQRFVPPIPALGQGALALVGLMLAALGSHDLRTSGIERWRSALEEIALCVEPLRELARLRPDEPPVCMNLEATTVALVYYYYGIEDHTEVRFQGFLDGVGGYVPLADPPAAPWFGRRCEGSYGIIEPSRYFTGRPALEPVRLYSSVLPAGSLGEARRLLAEVTTDLSRTVVAEGTPESFGALTLAGTLDARDASTELEILEPFVSAENWTATMRVRVRSASDVVLAYQDSWLYDPGYHFPPDSAITSGITLTRPIRLKAVTGDGQTLPTFFVNAYGLGVLVPPGEHEVQLDFSRASAFQLRGG